jgi:hypothetical protein
LWFTCAATLALALSGCVTPQVREATITRKSGVRVNELRFDTTISREQYIILGTVTGEGMVERKLMGKVPKERSFLSWLIPKSHYVLDFDRTLGAWTDEGRVNVDIVADRKMDAVELEMVSRMETIAARIALYKALESMPEADAIIAPRYDFTYMTDDKTLGKSQLLARSITSVKARITGKAVRIKSDDELYKTYREFPELAKPGSAD